VDELIAALVNSPGGNFSREVRNKLIKHEIVNSFYK